MTAAAPRRSAADRKVAGVCAGMAQHWGIDPLVVRVACVLLAVSGGVGVVLYLAGWLLMAPVGRAEPVVFDALGGQPRSWPRELWIVLVVVGSVVVLSLARRATPFGFSPVIVLALVWYFGYYRRRPGARRVGDPNASAPAPTGAAPALGPPHAGTPFAEAAAAWQQRVTEARVMAAQPPYPPYPTYPAETYSPIPGQAVGSTTPPQFYAATPDPVGRFVEAPPAPVVAPLTGRTSRARGVGARRLRLVALIVVVLALSALGALDHWVRPVPLAGYLATALLILGLTLVAAAWIGRARGLLPVAVLVMVATVVATASGPLAHAHGWTSQLVRYQAASQLVPGDQRTRGLLRVDLSELAMTQDASYRAHVDVGALVVTVPRNAQVVVNWRVQAGAFLVNEQQVEGGPDLHGVHRFAGRGPAPQTLVLDVSVDRGVLQVRR